MNTSATILLYCPDQKGLVLAVTDFIYRNGGNVLSLEQHIDPASGTFFMRVEWDLEGFSIPKDKVSEYFFTLVAERYSMTYFVYMSAKRPRMALFVSKMPHCFFDVLSRWYAGEFEVDIPLVISNHPDLEEVASRFGIPFHFLPITKENKTEQEEAQLRLLKEHQVDFVVLARYMQILSPDFISAFENRIINIHHSFLPAFPGAKPYHSAHERGVKIIGATSHYVTAELDAGPIISQDVAYVNHKNAVQDLVRMGKDLEKVVLARAIYQHLQRKVLVFGNRTIIFD